MSTASRPSTLSVPEPAVSPGQNSSNGQLQPTGTPSSNGATPSNGQAPKRVSRRSRWRAIFPLPTGKALGVLMIAVLLLAIAVGAIELPVLRHTHGEVLFPTDNAYVNITVGRDLAFYQVWGVSKYAFQSAASSLLYPIAVALLFFVFGAHLVIPLILNFLLGAYFLLMLQRTLIRYGLPLPHQFGVLAGAMLLTLLPLLVASGMEYTLELVVVFLFVDALTQIPEPPGTNPPGAADPLAANPPGAPHSAETPKAKSPLRRLYLLGLLAVAARYEDLLIILLAAVLLGKQKGWKPAATLIAIAVSPIVVFGIISLIKKNYFLPNSMLLAPYPIYAMIVAAVAVVTAVWWIIRVTAPGQKTPRRQPAAQLRPAYVILLLLTIPFTTRNASNLAHFETKCDHIYDGQYLSARFVHLYYYRSTVGVNEPGAVSYFSEGRKLDYTGIASNDVTKKKKENVWSPLWADSLSKLDGIRVAIVADPWFPQQQLPNWIKIASWDIPAGDPAPETPTPGDPRTITFYTLNHYDTSRLRQNLHSYEHLLPSNVSVKYY